MKSKRNIFLTGLLLMVAVGIFGFMGTLSIFKVINDLENGIPFTKTMFIVPLIFCPFSIYIIYYLLTYFPSISIDKNGIEISTIFRTKNYSWSEIKEIKLTGKQPHRFLFISMPVEATTILLNNNSEIYLWADYYRNKSDLRVILNRANKILRDNKKMATLDFNISRPDYTAYYQGDYEGKEFNGNHLYTVNGVLFYAWFAFIGYLIYIKSAQFSFSYVAAIVLPLVAFSIPGLLSYQMHYFIVTNKFLVVKNTFWFWRNDIYMLSDIREVVIETPHRLSTSLRVITNDFREKLYPAGSLSDKTWKELIRQINSDKIEVRNEAI
jgi:hypothetical protein